MNKKQLTEADIRTKFITPAIAAKEGITLSKLCREKLRDYSILARLQDTIEHINQKISKEEKILNLLRVSLKQRG